jgi:hypothetical protein
VRVRPSLALPLLIVTVACAAGLNRWPMWGDELWTYELLGLSFGDMVAKVAGDYHPPGYFTALWLLLGDTPPDWVLRFPSMVGAVGTVVIAGLLARRWFGEPEGALAGLVLALSPFLLVFGGVARAYSLLAFATSILLLACAHLVSGSRVRVAAIGIAAAGTAAIYLHYAAAAALVASAVGVAAGLAMRADRGRGRWEWAGGALLSVALLFVPWAVGPLQQQDGRSNQLARSIEVLRYLAWPVGPYQPALNWVLLALAGVGAVLLGRRRKPVDLLVLAWAACALVLPYLLSTRADIQFKLYVQSWFLPAWAILVAAGLAPLARRITVPGVGAALVLGVAAPLTTLWNLPASPFGVTKGNTAYDIRYDVRLFGEVLPAAPANDAFVSTLYVHYGGKPLLLSAMASRWRFHPRTEHVARSVYDPLASTPCAYVYAFHDRVLLDDFAQCLAILQAIEAVVETDPYPPYLLELAGQARAQGRLDDALQLARRAAAGAKGWSDPAVFLAQLYTQNARLDEALAVVDQGVETAIAWQNRLALLELYGMRAQLLLAAGRQEEAEEAARCAEGRTSTLACGE